VLKSSTTRTRARAGTDLVTTRYRCTLCGQEFRCSAIVFQQTVRRSAAVRTRMKEVGFFPSSPQGQWFDRIRPTRSREVLAKFGIALPKPEPRVSRSVEIGHRHWPGHEIRINRQALFERVWSEPVEKMAREWGLSGRGLAKACQRARVPVPPRGFWAKTQHGKSVRRPMLPKLPAGVAEKVVIYLTAPCELAALDSESHPGCPDPA
jgi:hypothetical protein